MKNNKWIASAMFAIFVSTAAQSDGALVFSLPGSSAYPFDTIGYFGSGPQTVAPGVTWTSTSGSSVFGFTGTYGFNGNGGWGGLSMIGLNSPNGSMSLSFDAPVTGVGAFINYATGAGVPNISIYDTTNTLIESFTPTFLTDGSTNSGQFLGFLLGTASISRLEFSNAYIGAANLEILGDPTISAVPEPGSIMALGGLLAGGLMIRQRKSRATARA